MCVPFLANGNENEVLVDWNKFCDVIKVISSFPHIAYYTKHVQLAHHRRLKALKVRLPGIEKELFDGT